MLEVSEGRFACKGEGVGIGGDGDGGEESPHSSFHGEGFFVLGDSGGGVTGLLACARVKSGIVQYNE
jgi:hypothetical protein